MITLYFITQKNVEICRLPLANDAIPNFSLGENSCSDRIVFKSASDALKFIESDFENSSLLKYTICQAICKDTDCIEMMTLLFSNSSNINIPVYITKIIKINYEI